MDSATQGDSGDEFGLRRAALTLLVLAMGIGLGACENPLDVNNPNDVAAEDLDNPTALPALVNGAEASATRAVGQMMTPYATVTDELDWIGSRDAWSQLNRGSLDDPANEFMDSAYPFLTEARFMADKAVANARQFDEAGTIADRTQLARALYWGGFVYVTIPEMFDNFVLPDDPQEAVPSVGESNMSRLYDTAIQRLSEALQVARSEGDVALERRILALRARAYHARAVWQKLNPPGSVPSDPLVSAQEAADDAQALLDMVGISSDWRWQLEYSQNTVLNDMAGWVNERGELQFGPAFVSRMEGDPTVITGFLAEDPIDGVPAPFVRRTVNEFTPARDRAPMTQLSAREAILILAEHDLAQGDTDGFTAHINDLRDLDGLTPYDGQVPAERMLEYSRKVNLFLQGRRLQDLYRFGERPQRWDDVSVAVQEPGTLFPLAITEIRSNPNVGG